jgi:hypothetical protein
MLQTWKIPVIPVIRFARIRSSAEISLLWLARGSRRVPRAMNLGNDRGMHWRPGGTRQKIRRAPTGYPVGWLARDSRRVPWAMNLENDRGMHWRPGGTRQKIRRAPTGSPVAWLVRDSRRVPRAMNLENDRGTYWRPGGTRQKIRRANRLPGGLVSARLQARATGHESGKRPGHALEAGGAASENKTRQPVAWWPG